MLYSEVAESLRVIVMCLKKSKQMDLISKMKVVAYLHNLWKLKTILKV